MHDPTSLFRFEEHDVYLPMGTLEELDNNKKGLSEVARNARQASRFLDDIVSAKGGDIAAGPADPHARGRPTRGRAPVPADRGDQRRPAGDPADRQDRQPDPRRGALPAEAGPARGVILVSKDINMRIKAHALGLAAEDYSNDKVLEDTDLLYTGVRELAPDFWDSTAATSSPGRRTAAPTTGSAGRCAAAAAERIRLRGTASARSTRGEGKLRRVAVLETVRDYYPRQEPGLGHQRAQPRAEFRAQPADEPGHRLRHPARPGGHRQDAADARRRA